MSIRVLHAPAAVGGQPSGLAAAERELGLDSAVLTVHEPPFGYAVDRVLAPSGTSVAVREWRRWRAVASARRFDVVHFNFGSSLAPGFHGSSGRGGRAYGLYARLLEQRDLPLLRGQALFVTFQGDDVRPSGDAGETRASGGGSSGSASSADGLYVLNPDLLEHVPEAEFLPYASVDPRAWTPVPPAGGATLRIVHAPSDRARKGTDDVLSAVDRLRDEGVEAELELVEGLTRIEARRALERADVVVDQLVVGWYGGVAVEAMALGKPVVARIDPSALGRIPAPMARRPTGRRRRRASRSPAFSAVSQAGATSSATSASAAERSSSAGTTRSRSRAASSPTTSARSTDDGRERRLGSAARDRDPRPERLPRRRGRGPRDRRRARRRRRGRAAQPRQALRRLSGAGRALVPRGRRPRPARARPRRDRPRPAREHRREGRPHDPDAAEPALRDGALPQRDEGPRRRGRSSPTRSACRPTSCAPTSTTSSTTSRTPRARSSSRRSTRRRCSRSTASATSPRRCSAHGRGNRLEVLDRVLFPHSLGIFYTAVTQWLGFPKYGDEGKVMGLAPYGDPERYLPTMRELVKLDGDRFELELDYFVHHKEGVDMTWDERTPTIGRLFSDRMERGVRARARAAQRADEGTTRTSPPRSRRCSRRRTSTSSARRTGGPGSKNLCLAGGVALNAVANGRIRPETPFEGVYVQPAAGDAGIAVGAAYYVWNQVLGQPRGFVMEHAYTGPAVRRRRGRGGDPRRRLRAASGLDDDAALRRTSPSGSPTATSSAGSRGGWSSARARSATARSSPTRGAHDMKDILNARIKHREPFRPFAPSILAEATGDWFEQDYPSPFMVLVYKTRAGQARRDPRRHPRRRHGPPADGRGARPARATTG